MVASVQWSKMTTCPARSGAGLMSRFPALNAVFEIRVARAASPAVVNPGPGSPRAMDAYPEQSRRYPPNQVVGSSLDRYGTGPPFHVVSQVAARARTASPSEQPFTGPDEFPRPVATGQVLTHCSGFSGIACQFAEPTVLTSRVASGSSSSAYASG